MHVHVCWVIVRWIPEYELCSTLSLSTSLFLYNVPKQFSLAPVLFALSPRECVCVYEREIWFEDFRQLKVSLIVFFLLLAAASLLSIFNQLRC